MKFYAENFKLKYDLIIISMLGIDHLFDLSFFKHNEIFFLLNFFYQMCSGRENKMCYNCVLLFYTFTLFIIIKYKFTYELFT